MQSGNWHLSLRQLRMLLDVQISQLAPVFCCCPVFSLCSLLFSLDATKRRYIPKKNLQLTKCCDRILEVELVLVCQDTSAHTFIPTVHLKLSHTATHVLTSRHP